MSLNEYLYFLQQKAIQTKTLVKEIKEQRRKEREGQGKNKLLNYGTLYNNQFKSWWKNEQKQFQQSVVDSNVIKGNKGKISP